MWPGTLTKGICYWIFIRINLKMCHFFEGQWQTTGLPARRLIMYCSVFSFLSPFNYSITAITTYSTVVISLVEHSSIGWLQYISHSLLQTTKASYNSALNRVAFITTPATVLLCLKLWMSKHTVMLTGISSSNPPARHRTCTTALPVVFINTGGNVFWNYSWNYGVDTRHVYSNHMLTRAKCVISVQIS